MTGAISSATSPAQVRPAWPTGSEVLRPMRPRKPCTARMPGRSSSSSVMAGRAKFTGRAVRSRSGFGGCDHRFAGGDIEGARAGLHFEATAFATFHDLDEEIMHGPRILQQLLGFVRE